MSRVNPIWWAGVLIGGALAASGQLALDWRPIGNQQIVHPTGDLASGPVERVWYTGSELHIRLASGRVLRHRGGKWDSVSVEPPPVQGATGQRRFKTEGDVLRSDDGGATWINLTRFGEASILGGAAVDVVTAPGSPDDVAVASKSGVWRSLDGGVTWAGLNEGLPNLPAQRIVSLPGAGQILSVESDAVRLEWLPGQRIGWTAAGPENAVPDSVIGTRGEFRYVGFSDGRILALRSGNALPLFRLSDSRVRAIWVDAADPATAIATAGDRIYRTFNGGRFWDDITGALNGGNLRGVTADRASGSIYAATDRGIAYGRFGFAALGSASDWQFLSGANLPEAPVADVRLDERANQLYVLLEGAGVFATMAPHRREFPDIVGAADGAAGIASPGALLRLIGRSVTKAESDGHALPVLAATEEETQLQVPFDADGTALPLRLGSGASNFSLSLPLAPVSPGIFEDRDGSPLVLDADSGVLLDAMNPARPSMRVQILAAGLGRVRPEWPAGQAAPLDDPPAVVAPVRIVLDGQPIEPLRATLAPGFAGFYLVEFEMPALLNAGTSELYLEALGRLSNRVKVYIEP